MEIPDIGNQVAQDIQLDEKEKAEFLKLRVFFLAQVSAEKILMNMNTGRYDDFDRPEIEGDLREYQTQYDALIGESSERIFEAMERYFRLAINSESL